ncbi:MAG: hypothetical protein IFK94_14580 [Acidobacteria bacterium]|uniref:HpcH/HpaI aldolase/citrate lyase domain-containing protein n=1 Tax=Candidatus Polarisedimenticola svalbardensis TaxID=2886004 RepID=A0A8J7CFD4_9BACT|nr:hypothetical protein [Candidatus Polarisedimenticola svalbardensis]
MLRKLDSLPADRLILDLEDGVAPGDKVEAGANLEQLVPSGAHHLIRINPPGTPWHEDDLAMAERLRPAGVVLPKAEEPEIVAGLATGGPDAQLCGDRCGLFQVQGPGRPDPGSGDRPESGIRRQVLHPSRPGGADPSSLFKYT